LRFPSKSSAKKHITAERLKMTIDNHEAIVKALPVGKLLDGQSDDNPINVTHFDTWFVDEDDIPMDIHEQPPSQVITLFYSIISSWSSSLGIVIETPEGAEALGIYLMSGLDGLFNPVIEQVIAAGYDVYSSENMIEIYEAEGSL
jgi:hypothetical protein